MTSSAWGNEAATEVMTTLRRVPKPRLRRTPLEDDVNALAESALVSSEGGDPAIGDLGREWFADVSLVLVDAVLVRDKHALDALDVLLRKVHRVLMIAQEEASAVDGKPATLDDLRCWENWLQLTMEFVRSALERIAPVAAAAAARGTHYERFLRIVAERPGINSRQITKLINVDVDSSAAELVGLNARRMDEGQLSKIGNKLRAQGLVFAERGRQGLSWELTPRGLLVVNRLLGAHENPDHPVDSMVIASKQVASGDVAAALSATKPREVTVLRHGDVVTYQRRIHDEAHQIDVAAKSGPKERNGTPPVAIETVVDDLLGRIHASAPSVFSIDDETVYEQVHRRVAAGAVLASR